MATVNEQIVTGRKFRKLVDEATKLWQRISFWTRASDVEFNDGSTAETKMGAINGITDSLVSTSSNIAASAKSVNQLNNKLAGQPEFVYGSDGEITGYKTPGGADTVFPFSGMVKSVELLIHGYEEYSEYDSTINYTCTEDYEFVFSIIGDSAINYSTATFTGKVNKLFEEKIMVAGRYAHIVFAIMYKNCSVKLSGYPCVRLYRINL